MPNLNLGKITMQFQLTMPDLQEREISFDFDTNRDTVQGVAEEMISELGLHPNYKQ